MKKIIAIQSNNLKTINPLTDTSLQLAIEAQNRGFKVFWYEANNLSIINSKLQANGNLAYFLKEKKIFIK